MYPNIRCNVFGGKIFETKQNLTHHFCTYAICRHLCCSAHCSEAINGDPIGHSSIHTDREWNRASRRVRFRGEACPQSASVVYWVASPVKNPRDQLAAALFVHLSPAPELPLPAIGLVFGFPDPRVAMRVVLLPGVERSVKWKGHDRCQPFRSGESSREKNITEQVA